MSCEALLVAPSAMSAGSFLCPKKAVAMRLHVCAMLDTRLKAISARPVKRAPTRMRPAPARAWTAM